jgi:hypothetical protein
MSKADTAPTRSPRGTKPVSQAFFTALDAVPDVQRTAVARAAQAMIRDELKTRREKAKAASAKEKARQPAKKAPVKKAVAKAKAPVKTSRGQPARRARLRSEHDQAA